MNREPQVDPRSYRPAPDALRERIILVTGAGDGIGAAVSRALASYGATVILLGRTVSKLEKVYDEIVASGAPQPAIVPMNLEQAQGPDYDHLVERLEQEYGRLDGLLNNAGVLGELTPIEQYDPVLWQRVMHVNLTAGFLITQACLPLLCQSADASVIFTSSGVGRRGKAFWGAYAVSKFATEGLCQVLADEYENKANLRFNCINPGATRTSMRRKAYPGEPVDKPAKAETIVGPYLYLLGPDSREINGASLDCQ